MTDKKERAAKLSPFSRSGARLLRIAPIAVLSTMVVVAVVSRRTNNTTTTTTSAPLTTILTSRASGEDAAPPGSLASSLRVDDAIVVGGDASAPSTWWRAIHGGATHQHRAAAHGPKQATKIGFRAKVDGPVAAQVTASPDEQTLYVSTLAGSVIALSRVDGTKKWSVSIGERNSGQSGSSERVYSAPLVHEDGTIYVGTDTKKFIALSPAKGDVIFRLDTDGEADTAAVFAKDGNTIVFAAGTQVHAVRRGGGDLAWRFAAKNKVFTSPAITQEGVVVFGSQDHRAYALNSAGVLAWSTDLGADVDGAAAIGDDGAIYIGTDLGEVVRLGLADGKVLWRTQIGGFVRGTLSVARNGDVLAGTYGPVPRVVRLRPDGSIRGAFAIRGTGAKEFGIHGAPLEDEDGVLYFGAQDNAAYAIGTDGLQKWRFETGADVDAPLTMLSDGSLVVPSEDGTVTLLLP